MSKTKLQDKDLGLIEPVHQSSGLIKSSTDVNARSPRNKTDRFASPLVKRTFTSGVSTLLIGVWLCLWNYETSDM